MDNFIFEAKEPPPPAQSKKVAVMVGRLNPPTRGHYRVINEMKAFIRKNRALGLEAQPVVVIVAGSKSDADKSRNPLTGEERRAFLEASGKANGVKFLVAPNAFDAFSEVRRQGYEPVAIAAGADRAASYMEMLKKYFTDPDGEPIERHLISLDRDFDAEGEDGPTFYQKVVDMINDGDTVDDRLISGSLARYAVKNDEPKAFAYVVGLEKKPALAEKLFKKIKETMNVKTV